ncbi:hypothetical protein KF728_08230 [Candidatus Obscuribacterales bacterium]|nr:hypothetical protein [Candidatus Obscuribacterales bacterium]
MKSQFVRRSKKGNMSEFGSAFLLLITFIFLPLLNMSFVPVRYMICEGALTELCRRLAHSERFSDAQAMLAKEQWYKTLLNQCGVTVSGEKLTVLVTTADGARSTIKQSGVLPSEWLPGGSNGPCIYSLELKADCTISALYQGPFKPAKMTLRTHSQWENLSKDPGSLEYFINE